MDTVSWGSHRSDVESRPRYFGPRNQKTTVRLSRFVDIGEGSRNAGPNLKEAESALPVIESRGVITKKNLGVLW